MSETPAAPAVGPGIVNGDPTGEANTPATPAQDTDWKAEARKWEQRAKENIAKAKANDDAAKRLAEIEEASKTAEQKASERLELAEKRAAELELKADRAEVAALKSVPVDLISGSTREEMEASADKLIEFRGVATPTTPKPDLTQGATSALPLNGDALENALRAKLGI